MSDFELRRGDIHLKATQNTKAYAEDYEVVESVYSVKAYNITMDDIDNTGEHIASQLHAALESSAEHADISGTEEEWQQAGWRVCFPPNLGACVQRKTCEVNEEDCPTP